MRSSAVVRFGVGLLVGSVRASSCKPHSTTATTVATSEASSSFWASDISSSTIVSSVDTQASSTTLGLDVIETTTTAEDTATTADVSSSSIVFSVETPISSTVLEPGVAEGTTTATDTFTTTDVDDATTTELSTISRATTSAAPSTITSEATTTAADTATTIDVEDTTTTDLTTTSEAIFSAATTTATEVTTSAIPTTTTSEAPWPLETFALISSLESGPLMGSTDLYRDTYFGADGRYYTTLTLTIEPGTNRLRIAGGRYLCTAWGVLEWPGAIITCDVENSEVKYIECSQANNGELSCRGKAAQCGFGPGGLTCSSNDDYVSQFLVQQQEDGNRLFLAYAPSDEFSGITLKAVQAGTQ